MSTKPAVKAAVPTFNRAAVAQVQQQKAQTVAKPVQHFGHNEQLVGRNVARYKLMVQWTTADSALQTVLKAGMPQLVPFFFVNEVTYAFVIIPTLIYLMSKYILPQRVRAQAARMFISKL